MGPDDRARVRDFLRGREGRELAVVEATPPGRPFEQAANLDGHEVSADRLRLSLLGAAGPVQLELEAVGDVAAAPHAWGTDALRLTGTPLRLRSTWRRRGLLGLGRTAEHLEEHEEIWLVFR